MVPISYVGILIFALSTLFMLYVNKIYKVKIKKVDTVNYSMRMKFLSTISFTIKHFVTTGGWTSETIIIVYHPLLKSFWWSVFVHTWAHSIKNAIHLRQKPNGALQEDQWSYFHFMNCTRGHVIYLCHYHALGARSLSQTYIPSTTLKIFTAHEFPLWDRAGSASVHQGRCDAIRRYYFLSFPKCFKILMTATFDMARSE